MTEDSLQDIRRNLLNAALDHVPFDGWSDVALKMAADDIGIGADEARAAFPGAPLSLIEFFMSEADRWMVEALQQENLDEMKIRERIIHAIKTRLEPLTPHRDSIRRALHILMMPQNSPVAAKGLYRTCDAIWRAIGDTSTDWNFYTKRMTLAGVYSSTLLVWLNDESEDLSESWAFLDRRIDDVMKIEGMKADWRGLCERLPDITRIIGDLRYYDPRRPRY